MQFRGRYKGELKDISRNLILKINKVNRIVSIRDLKRMYDDKMPKRHSRNKIKELVPKTKWKENVTEDTSILDRSFRTFFSFSLTPSSM